MKKTFTLCALALFLLSTSSIVAQVSILNEDLRWNMIFSGWGPTHSFTIKFEGDTILNNLTYKKVYYSYDSLNVDWVRDEHFIREDDQQRVYTQSMYGDDERLVFDFSVSVGETIEWLSFEGCPVVVTDIEQVLYPDGVSRKTITLSYPDIFSGGQLTTQWIEGVGNIEVGPLFSAGPICSTDWEVWLLCAYNQGEIFYGLDASSCFVVDVDDLLIKEGVNVYPNPTNGMLRIDVQAAGLHVEQISLYNSIGQRMPVLHPEGQFDELDITDLPQGIYYLKVHFDSGQFSMAKVLKTD